MEADAKKCEFLPVLIFGRQGLFCGVRIERASVPKGWHMYEIRHHPENPKRPVQIGKMAVNHFYGTVLTLKAIRFPEGEWDFREIIGNRDLRFLGERAATLKEYEKQKQRKKHGR
ncbi:MULTISPECIES: LPD28 domain-containing protein [Clostridia]|uniref:LPD28 domain-containing protein n=1 Tax=Clostridia TaxID=186801 RepID=UPI00067EBEA2|nr:MULTISPECIES: LPD28 domain-containing protein [Clostridia]